MPTPASFRTTFWRKHSTNLKRCFVLAEEKPGPGIKLNSGVSGNTLSKGGTGQVY